MLNKTLFVTLSRLTCLTMLFAMPQATWGQRDNSDKLPAPNVVVMMLDDLGYSDLGCYGAQHIQTPTIDGLAKQGLRFSQFYNTAKCHSSRICLLTGLYPFQAGNNAIDRGATIAEVLAGNGYFTAMTGKWHLDGQPTDHGFARYFGHLSGATNFFTGDDTFRLNGKPWSEFDDDFYTTDANTDYAIQFVDEALASRKPFFLYVAHNAPHYPLHAREEDYRKYEGKFAAGWDQLRQQRYEKQLALGLLPADAKLSPRPDSIPAWESLSEDWQKWESERMAAYAAMVDRVDQNLDRLIEHLKAQGVWENTLFMLCSDNGGCPFERTRRADLEPFDPKSYWTYDVGWAHASNTPFRWFKQNQHEGGIASPLIVHWPAGLKTAPGQITAQPGHLIDLLPTVVEACQASYPAPPEGSKRVSSPQGKSLFPILQGTEREQPDWFYFMFSDNRALRQGDWKLVSARGGRWELYNLAEDRTELNDLAQQHPAKVNELRQLWFQAAREVDGVPKPRQLRPAGNRLLPFPQRQMSDRTQPAPR